MTTTTATNSVMSNTNGGVGFGGLASSALPSLGGDPLTRPTWKRSLQELAASNMALMGNASSSGFGASGSAPPTATAQILLGSRTDFGSLLSKGGSNKSSNNNNNNNNNNHQQQQQRQAQSIASSSSRYSFDAMSSSGGGIEAVVRRHRDGMLERILQDQREQTQRLLDKAVEHQIEDDWKEERRWWRKELVGDRNLVNATAIGRDKNNGSDGYNPLGVSNSQLHSNPSRGLLVADYGSSGRVHNPININNNNNANHTMFATGCDPKSMQEHLTVVQQIEPTSDPLRVVATFEPLAAACSSGGSANGYKNAWRILVSMLPRMQTPVSAAQGAQTHFCKQYQTILHNHVKSAGLAGQDVSPPVRYDRGGGFGSNGGSGAGSMATMIASYVKLVSGSQASVWEILYYCLRCGDANAANAVLDATPAGREEFSEQPILSQVIGQLSARQGSASCMFEASSPMVMAQDRFAVLDLYEKTKNLESSNQHKLSVLALLCGQRLESFSTVEDYLFGCLWVALMDKEDPIKQIEVIGASIRKYGPSHFAADGSGEWGYVLPLIAAQQFETALSYLAEAGGPTGLMQASHLAIVFALANVAVKDLDRGDASSSSRRSKPRDIVTALLVNYATLTEREPSMKVLASLEYLLKIPNIEESNYQIANLIHRSPPDQIDVLSGVLDAVGNRTNSLLDKRVPEKTVSAILVTAAGLFQKQSSDRSRIEQSAKLFMLGYRHTKLVQLLNEQISPVHDVSNENANYWEDQSKLFYDAYLSKRSNVLDSIEREGKLNLIHTNRYLLELRSFFRIYKQRSFEEAFGKVTSTGLLPRSREELDEKSSNFRDLDPILKREFPAVVGAAVECLCEIFHRLKSESPGLPALVKERLNEIQFLARYLFTFAGLIHMPRSCMSDIQQMRANMIV